MDVGKLVADVYWHLRFPYRSGITWFKQSIGFIFSVYVAIGIGVMHQIGWGNFIPNMEGMQLVTFAFVLLISGYLFLRIFFEARRFFFYAHSLLLLGVIIDLNFVVTSIILVLSMCILQILEMAVLPSIMKKRQYKYEYKHRGNR
jgi:hypothetical protein